MAAALCLILSATGATAQQDPPEPAILVADRITIEAGNRLVASGNVEALQGEARLTASRIVYDGDSDRLVVEGPMTLSEPALGSRMLADAADLSSDLRDGLVEGARIVLDDRLQLASTEARRVDGRYLQMSRVAVTACRVCNSGRAPLWRIRARRVVHDAEAGQIYFDHATLQVLGVPVFYAPRLRMPDPDNDRARGFLIPRLRSTTLLGTGVKLPYFVPLGDHRDLTLTPYLSAETTTLEMRYRQAFRSGTLTLTGALSRDTLRPNTLRGYVFADASFRLPRDLSLTLDLKAVNRPGYLSDYGISGTDRLLSTVRLSRVRGDTRLGGRLMYFETLRDFERNDTQPGLITDLGIERRFFPRALGGELRLRVEADGALRRSKRPFDGPDADLDVDGRDTARLTAETDWRRRWTLPGGLRAGARAALWIDHYQTWQDDTAAASVTRAVPGAAVDLRWPLVRAGQAGGRSLLEPVVQVGWMGDDERRQPNDDSTRAEFDEANLLALSRFPGADRRERDASAVAGLRWMHRAPSGWSSALTVGRVWRADTDAGFDAASGLDRTASDWLVATRLTAAGGASLAARGLVDDAGQVVKAQARSAVTLGRLGLGLGYALLETGVDSTPESDHSEWSLDADLEITRLWSASTDWRFDLMGEQLDQAGLGLQYRNECVEIRVGATRRFASSRLLEPSTEFDLTVALLGFGTGGTPKETRQCSQ